MTFLPQVNAFAINVGRDIHIYSFPENQKLATLHLTQLKLTVDEVLSDLKMVDADTIRIASSTGKVWTWWWRNHEIELIKTMTGDAGKVILDPSASVVSILKTFGSYPNHRYEIAVKKLNDKSTSQTLSIKPQPIVVTQSFSVSNEVRYLAWIEANISVSIPGPDDTGTIRLIELSSTNDIKPKELKLENAPDNITSLSFSPKADLIAAASESHLSVWRLSDGALVIKISLPSIVSEGLVFHPEGSHVIAPGDDYKIRFYEVVTGDLVSTLDFNRGVIGGANLTFDKEGKYLLAGFFATHHPQSWLWQGANVYKSLCDRLKWMAEHENWQELLESSETTLARCMSSQ
jgi:WD40 repeat protein